MPPEYVHSVEKMGVVSVPLEDSEAADNKAHPSNHLGKRYCAGAAHCCSLDEHSDLPVPNLDLATGALLRRTDCVPHCWTAGWRGCYVRSGGGAL